MSKRRRRSSRSRTTSSRSTSRSRRGTTQPSRRPAGTTPPASSRTGGRGSGGASGSGGTGGRGGASGSGGAGGTGRGGGTGGAAGSGGSGASGGGGLGGLVSGGGGGGTGLRGSLSSLASSVSRGRGARLGSGRKTAGGLIPARIYAIDSSERPISNSLVVHCAFNPNKYNISVTNSISTKGLNPFTMNYNIETDLKQEKPRELKLQELWFDAYENRVQDVRPITETLMDLAQLKDTSGSKRGNAMQKLMAALKPKPGKIMFEWGSFKFRGLIKNLSIDYVMFTENGTPVRAKASLTLMEYRHRKAYPRQNPTSGGAPTESIWVVSAGDRLDTISAEVYGDSTQWRLIASHNRIEDPLNLRPGQELAIPIEL